MDDRISLIGVVMTDDLALPDIGTPTDWKITVVNTSGQRITETFSIECATGANGSTSAASSRARQARQHPIIVKKIIRKLPRHAKS